MQFLPSGSGRMGCQAQRQCKKTDKIFKPKTKELDVIWWRIDENTHQSVIIFASEQDAKDEVALRNENRKNTAEASGHKMVEETMEPIISIMSDL